MSTYLTPGIYTELIPSLRQPIFGVGTNVACFIGIVQDTVWVPRSFKGYDPILARDRALLEKLLANRRAGDAEQLVGLVARLQADLGTLERNVVDTTAGLAQKEAAVAAAQQALDAAQAAVDANERGAAAKRAKAANDLQQANEELEQQTAAKANAIATRDDLSRRLDAARNQAAAAPGGGAAGGAGAAGAAAGGGGAGGAGPGAPGAAAIAPAGGAVVAAKPVAGGFEKEDRTYKDTPPDQKYQGPSVDRPYFLEECRVKAAPLTAALCTNMTEYFDQFGGSFSGYDPDADDPDTPLNPGHHMLTHAVNGFLVNGGQQCFVVRVTGIDQLKDAMEIIETLDEVALLAAPGCPKIMQVWEGLEDYCELDSHANVFAILDSGAVLNDGTSEVEATSDKLAVTRLDYTGADPKTLLLPRRSPKAAFYAPAIQVVCPAKLLQDRDPARGVDPEDAGLTYVSPSGHVAGIYARSDEERGVYKTPANEIVRGALDLKYDISKAKQGSLNPQGVNCIRNVNGAITVWGGRTIGGQRNSDLTYIGVVRMIGFLRKSIEEGTQWAVFEPNGPQLWSRIVFNIKSFLTNVWRDGGLFGLTPQEAFFVRCDAELNPESVRSVGMVVTEVGVALLKPAEFVVFRISQWSADDAKS